MNRTFYGVSRSSPEADLAKVGASSDSILQGYHDPQQLDYLHYVFIDEFISPNLSFVRTGILNLDDQLSQDRDLFADIWQLLRELQIAMDNLMDIVRFYSQSIEADDLSFCQVLVELDYMLSDKFLSIETYEEIAEKARLMFKKCSLVLEFSESMRTQCRSCSNFWESALKNFPQIRSGNGMKKLSSKASKLKHSLKGNVKKSQENEFIIEQAISRALAISDLFHESLSKANYKYLFGGVAQETPLMNYGAFSTLSMALEDSYTYSKDHPYAIEMYESISVEGLQPCEINQKLQATLIKDAA